jgi:hypothetical protein
MPLDEILAMQGRQGGLEEHGERITLKIVPLKDLWKSTRDVKALSSLALLQHYMNGDLH